MSDEQGENELPPTREIPVAEAPAVPGDILFRNDLTPRAKIDLMIEALPRCSWDEDKVSLPFHGVGESWTGVGYVFDHLRRQWNDNVLQRSGWKLTHHANAQEQAVQIPVDLLRSLDDNQCATVVLLLQQHLFSPQVDDFIPLTRKEGGLIQPLLTPRAPKLPGAADADEAKLNPTRRAPAVQETPDGAELNPTRCNPADQETPDNRMNPTRIDPALQKKQTRASRVGKALLRSLSGDPDVPGMGF